MLYTVNLDNLGYQIWLKSPIGPTLGMANIIARGWLLIANLYYFGHNESS